MILQALVEYYDRRFPLDDGTLAPQGWEWKLLPFIVEITPRGGFVQIVDTRVPDGKRLRAAPFLVPKRVKRSVNVAPFLLWDNVEYVLGLPVKTKPERVAKYHAAFVKRVIDVFGERPTDVGVAALLHFVANPPTDDIQADSSWPEVLKAINPFVGIRLAGQAGLVSDCPSPAAVDTHQGGGICLVTGERRPIARLHDSITGLRGGNTTGTTFVGFNGEAFKSYGHDQGDHAPVGLDAMFKYTTALSALLAPGSRNSVWPGDSSVPVEKRGNIPTFVFWAEQPDGPGGLAEEGAVDLFSGTARDDPDAGVGQVRDAITALAKVSWTAVPDRGGRFYVLCVAPNVTRIAVKSWTVATVREVAERLLLHFQDVDIAKPPFASEHPGLRRLLGATAVQAKPENVPSSLHGEVASAILTGRPYPLSLLAASLRRTSAEGSGANKVGRERVDWELRNWERAALIKAVINRHRRASGEGREELSVALDTANADPAYRLGRLFAALERAQETASPGLNATIKDRYYGAASSTPITVFPRLLDLKNHHVAKIESPHTRAWLERLIGEIVDGIPKIPAHLSLIQQGDFAIGYYHQRQDFFRKHTSEGESN